MEVVAAIGTVYTLYQIASYVGEACFNYAQGVKHADTEADSCLYEIQNFQRSLLRLSVMLQDEKSNANTTGDRLQALREIMDEEAYLSRVRKDMEKLQKKLKAEQEQNLKGAVKVLMRKLKWPMQKEEVKKMLDNMREVSEQIDRAQGADTTQMVRSIDVTTKDTNARTKVLGSAVQRIQDRQESQEDQRKREKEEKDVEDTREKIFAWLEHADPAENHNIACKARNEDAKTGLWFIELDKFDSFKHTSRSLLWLHGNAGCGKTVLSSTVIEHIRAMVKGDAKIALAYWYFNRNEKAKINVDSCLRALITQVMVALPKRIPKSIQDLWNTKGNRKELPKLSDLSMALQTMIGQENLTYFVVLDALDEAQDEDRTEILEAIRGLLDTDHSDVHVLVTSRPYVKEDFQKQSQNCASFFDIAIEREHVDADIKMHIEEQLKSDLKLCRWNQRVKDMISANLLEKAEGMFRWVDCQLQALRKCNNESAVKKVLHNLPKNLQEQYQQDLGNVPDEDDEYVENLLKWLTYPQRKIRTDEVLDLLAVDYDADTPQYEPDMKLFDLSPILGLCGSLVRIDVDEEGVNHFGEVASVETLTTSHATVLDFLTQEPIKVGSRSEIRFTRSTINLQMATTCLVYLNSVHRLGVVFSEDNLKDWPCARFCAEYWDDFYREIDFQLEDDVDRKARLIQLVIDLFDSKEALLQCIRLSDPNNERERVDFTRTLDDLDSPLYYASLHGLLDIVQHYIDKGEDINYRTHRGYGTPLAAACAHGRTNVVTALLKAGADPNIWGNTTYGRSLAAAIIFNRVEVMKILLQDSRVDVNARRCRDFLILEESGTTSANPKANKEMDSPGIDVAQTPDVETSKAQDSHAAAVNPSTISEPADGVNDGGEGNNQYAESATSGGETDSYFYETMVYLAAEYDAPEALALLLDLHADVNVTGGYYQTPLQAAATYGRESIVETLLAHGARADVYGGASGSALLAALEKTKGYAVIEKLIRAGSDVNRGGGADKNYTPLYSASCVADKDTIKLLLESGATASINVRDCGLFDNALQGACQRGDSDIVQLLLDYGADVNLEGQGEFDNCFSAAVAKGHADVAKLLLAKGVSPNRNDPKMTSPLIRACFEGWNSGESENYIQVVQVLLDAGADPNLVKLVEGDYKGLSAIFFAMNIPQFEALIEHGADVNEHCEVGGTPLRLAILRDKPDLVTWLIDHGASMRTPDSTFGYPFINACEEQSVEMVTLLVGHADVDAMDDVNRGTALHIATKRGSQEILDLLIRSHADPHLTHWYAGTVLMSAVESGSLDIFDEVYEVVGRVTDGVNMMGLNVLLLSLRSSSWEMTEKVLEHGPDIHHRDKFGRDGIHYAAGKSQLLFIEKAVDNKMDMNSLDNNGWSALHWAAASHLDTTLFIRSILQKGVNLQQRDKQGRSALNLAEQLGNAAEAAVIRTAEVVDSLFVSNDTQDLQKMRHQNIWGGRYCDGCGNKRGDCYHCKSCNDFDFCFRCILDANIVHFPDHEFERVIEDRRLITPAPPDQVTSSTENPNVLLCEPTGLEQFHYSNDLYTIECSSDDDAHRGYAISNNPFVSACPYFEVKIEEIGSADTHSLGIGLAVADAKKVGMVGWEFGSWGFHSDDGKVFLESSSTKYNTPSAAGDVVGCGLDPYIYSLHPSNRAVFFTRNGQHLGSFMIDLHERVFPVVTTRGEKVSFRVNFGQEKFLWQGERYQRDQ